jgi:putative oxidoreductase
MRQAIASWEGEAHSVLRVILSFLISLHGFRVMFHLFPILGGRRGASFMALDSLPQALVVLEIACSALLFLGLFTRPIALILAVEMAAAYFYAAAPRGPWPIRNGGEEVVIYFFVLLCFAAAGAGTWSLDTLIRKRKEKVSAGFRAASAPAAM